MFNTRRAVRPLWLAATHTSTIHTHTCTIGYKPFIPLRSRDLSVLASCYPRCANKILYGATHIRHFAYPSEQIDENYHNEEKIAESQNHSRGYVFSAEQFHVDDDAHQDVYDVEPRAYSKHILRGEEDNSEHLDLLEAACESQGGWRVAHKILDEVRSADGNGVTPNLATALIRVYSIHHMADYCLETMRYARDMNVRPRIHAYSSTIAACYKEQKYAHALRVFEIMRDDGYVPKLVTYSRALSSALKSNRHEVVLEIFDDMIRNRVDPNIVIYNNILNSCARIGDVHSAIGVHRAIRERKMEMTMSTYHSLAICAGKTGRYELAQEAYSGIKLRGFTPAMPMYNSVITAFAKGKRWPEIICLYSEMSEESRVQLRDVYLGGVLMAFAKSPIRQEQDQALEIFTKVKEERPHAINGFAYNALMVYYLNTQQYDKVQETLKIMKKSQYVLDTLSYQTSILAYIRSGDVMKAETMLKEVGPNMTQTTHCYRALIDYYASVKKDKLKACRISMEMMAVNRILSRLDWHTALTHAITLENKSVYWNFRKWMLKRAPNLIDEVPKELMLPDDAIERLRKGKKRKGKSNSKTS